jgi:hypothetical protein
MYDPTKDQRLSATEQRIARYLSTRGKRPVDAVRAFLGQHADPSYARACVDKFVALNLAKLDGDSVTWTGGQ